MTGTTLSPAPATRRQAGVELVAGILVFTWIVLFIRKAAALEQDSRSTA